MQKKAPKVTVREIAKQTGYAHCTVARALSDAGNVALETRSRILAAARELGYLGRSRKNIAVIMHAGWDSRFTEAAALLDHGFEMKK